jgi:hypothetical protein
MLTHVKQIDLDVKHLFAAALPRTHADEAVVTVGQVASR